MLLFPLIYLKNGKAQKPVGTNPTWFQESGLALAKTLIGQGAQALYCNDLNVPQTGRSENLGILQEIIQQLKSQVWVAGNFRGLSVIESYLGIGVDKINVGPLAYQNPNLFQEVCQQFPQKIMAPIEVRNKHVVIPGMVSPAHKTALDYAKRFEEAGCAALAYSDSNPQGILEDQNFMAIQEFCNQVKIPVLSLNDIVSTHDLEKMFAYERSGLIGVVMGKSLYENRLDLHSSIAFLNDLAVVASQEPTLREE